MKKYFQENLALSRTTSHGILGQRQNFEKNNNTILRKRMDRPKVRRTDRRTSGKTDRHCFHKILPATAGGPKI